MKKIITVTLLFCSTIVHANIQSYVENSTFIENKNISLPTLHAYQEKSYQLRTAFTHCHKSAKKGSVSAKYELGLMFHYGVGVRQNLELARLWLTRASKNGHPKAQSILYRFYSIGKNDHTLTVRYTRKLA